MADVIHVQHGFSPWAPSLDASLVKEYRYYDIPLDGVVAQQGARFMFTCIAGEDQAVSFWLYVYLSAEDEARLDAAEPDAFDRTLHLSGPALLALAIEGPGIIGSVVVDELKDHNEIRSAARQLVDQLVSWAHAASATAKGLELTHS